MLIVPIYEGMSSLPLLCSNWMIISMLLTIINSLKLFTNVKICCFTQPVVSWVWVGNISHYKNNNIDSDLDNWVEMISPYAPLLWKTAKEEVDNDGVGDKDESHLRTWWRSREKNKRVWRRSWRTCSVYGQGTKMRMMTTSMAMMDPRFRSYWASARGWGWHTLLSFYRVISTSPLFSNFPPLFPF